jgi:predicted transcriptional regulator
LAGLVKAVDRKISDNPELKAFAVILTDDAAATSKSLKSLAKDKGIKNVPLTLVADLAGPPDYQIAEEAGVTVMMWKGQKVEVNHAFPRGKMTDADVKTVVSDIPKILGN